MKRYGDGHVQERGSQRLRLHEASLSAGFGSLEVLGFRLDAPLLQCSNRISSFDWFAGSISYSGPQKRASVSGQPWKLRGVRPNARGYLPSRRQWSDILGELDFCASERVCITVHRFREGQFGVTADITR